GDCGQYRERMPEPDPKSDSERKFAGQCFQAIHSLPVNDRRGGPVVVLRRFCLAFSYTLI
ncbi:MAG: hypothetical protein VX505_00315, partial [Chloroflexota bacterium]|nr:hypothetical protein [Chloroflexota bacterium]